MVQMMMKTKTRANETVVLHLSVFTRDVLCYRPTNIITVISELKSNIEQTQYRLLLF